MAPLGCEWLSWLDRHHCRAYAIIVAESIVGLIMLHDWLPGTDQALVGYALLPMYRGRGIGSQALSLLQEKALALGLARLTIITGCENRPSRGIAEHCGFVYVGPAREDPDHLVVYEWQAPTSVGA